MGENTLYLLKVLDCVANTLSIAMGSRAFMNGRLVTIDLVNNGALLTLDYSTNKYDFTV